MESSQRLSNYIIPTKRDSDAQNRDFIPQCKELRSFQLRFWEMKSFEKIINLNGAKSKSMFRACGHLNKSIKITLSLKDSYQKWHRSHLEINYDEKGSKWMIVIQQEKKSDGHFREKDGQQKPKTEPLEKMMFCCRRRCREKIHLKKTFW